MGVDGPVRRRYRRRGIWSGGKGGTRTISRLGDGSGCSDIDSIILDSHATHAWVGVHRVKNNILIHTDDN